jgi:hypothetical protein
VKHKSLLFCAAFLGLPVPVVFGVPDSSPQAAHPPKSEVGWVQLLFLNIQINGQPAQFYLDTGSECALLTEAGASRLGVKSQALPSDKFGADNWGRERNVAVSEPMRLTVDRVNSTVRLPVLNAEMTDGFFGWPEVKDDILLFDGGNQTVSCLDQLPPDLAGWIKLKVPPGHRLLLETTMPDGTTGKILVDTGGSFSIVLSKARGRKWLIAWMAAHPVQSALFKKRADLMVDQLPLGSFTLSNVWVRPANFEDSLAVIGRLGLTRLDLIVDGKNGEAYLRLRPGVGPWPSDSHWDHWTIKGQIPVNVAPMLALVDDMHLPATSNNDTHARPQP